MNIKLMMLVSVFQI